MIDGNTAALNAHMAEQDRADRTLDIYGEQARQELSDKQWNDDFDSVMDDLRGLLEDISEPLTDRLAEALYSRDACESGNLLLQLLDAKCDSLVSRDAISDRAHDLARGE